MLIPPQRKPNPPTEPQEAQCVDELASAVLRVSQGLEWPCVIAIDGRSGSGKTTLAVNLAHRIGAAIITGDDFYIGGTELRNDSPGSRMAKCIDWVDQRSVLQSLRTGNQATWHAFDWATFDGRETGEPRMLRATQYIILEGVYSARPELQDLIDIRILFEIPPYLRKDRLIRREGQLGPWEAQWQEAEDHYFGTIVHREEFDFIFNG